MLLMCWEDHIRRHTSGSGQSTRSWSSNAKEEAGRHAASPLKWGVGVLLAAHCARFTRYLASPGLQKGKPSSPPWRRQREPPDGFGSGGAICGLMLLGHKPGTDHPWLGRLREDV